MTVLLFDHFGHWTDSVVLKLHALHFLKALSEQDGNIRRRALIAIEMAALTEHMSFNGDWDAQSIVVVTCASISIYNCAELLLLIFTNFKGWRTLYFASLLAASIGIIPYCLGFLLEYFRLAIFWVAMILSSIGWVLLITGQAFVLYSRLNLIVTNEGMLRAVKWMIIVDAIVFHVTVTVIQYGSNYGAEQHAFSRALFYMEKVQMTAFCIQEFIISGIYVWKTTSLLKVISKEDTRRVMWELFSINVIIIVMDIALLVLEYKGLRVLERAFKSFVYSVKLKLEFAILGKLIDLVQSSSRKMSNALGDVHSFVDPSRTISHDQALSSAPLQDEEVPSWMLKLENKPSFRHVEEAGPSHMRDIE